MKEYRRKSKTVEAILWTKDNLQEVKDFFEDGHLVAEAFTPDGICDTLYFKNSEGTVSVSIGNYIVKEDNGEYYSYEADRFEQIYEENNS
jgi:hypothetical protein